MSVKIQINSLEALERMIGGDNEIEIQVRSSIVQEFAKKHLKAVAQNIQSSEICAVKDAIRKEVQDQMRDSNGVLQVRYNNIAELTPQKKAEIKELVLKQMQTEFDLLVSADGVAFNMYKLTNDKLEKALNDAVSRIENKITDAVLTGRIEKMVDAKLKERLGLS